MADERFYERHAWIFFVVVALAGLIGAAMTVLSPSSGEGLFERFGFTMPAAIAGDPEAVRYVEHVFQWAGGSTLGLNLFALLIAVTAFRRGQRWAWLAFWFWPAMFLSHFFTYESGFRIAQPRLDDRGCRRPGGHGPQGLGANADNPGPERHRSGSVRLTPVAMLPTESRRMMMNSTSG